MLCSSCFMPDFPLLARSTCYFPPFPSPWPLELLCPCLFPSPSNLFLWVESWKKNESTILWAGWDDFSEDLDSSLQWFQLRKYILPKINSSLCTVLQLEGTKQMAMKPRTAFIEHPETVMKGPAPRAPKWKLCHPCVWVCVHRAFKLTHKESRSESLFWKEQPVQLPTSSLHIIGSGWEAGTVW